MQLDARAFVAAVPLALFTALAGCGGDGGGGGNGDGGITPAPPLPPVAAWQFASPTGDFTAAVDFGNDQPVTVAVPVINFAGEWTTATDDLTVRNGPADPNAMQISAPAVLPADVFLTISDPLVWSASSDHPTSGRFEILYATSSVAVTCGPVDVLVDLDSGSQTATLTWDQLDDISFGGPEPEYQQIASFGYGAMSFLLEQLGRGVEGLQTIRFGEVAIHAAGPGNTLVENGDWFPPLARTGTFSLTWLDDGVPDGQGEVGPGDDFVAAFTDYWTDDPQDDVDELLDGTIRFVDYVENADPLFLGFDRVTFESFTITETIDDAGTFRTGTQTVVDGSVLVQLSAANGS